jgi:hypothetical protein
MVLAEVVWVERRDKVIMASEWDVMGTWEILQSIEIAIRVLGDRDLSNGELYYISLLIQDLAKIMADRLGE